MLNPSFMKKWLFFGGVVLAVIFTGCWWFWSLGNVQSSDRVFATISLDTGITEIRRGSADWRTAINNEQVFAQDAIRTQAGARATIHWFGSGESRLEQSTEVSVQDAAFDRETAVPFTVKLTLSSGRMWSRLLRLLDLNATYSVQANKVVATVRGTAFDMSASSTGTMIAVSDSAVQVDAKDMPVFSSGTVARFDANGRLLGSDKMSEEARSSAWFEKNRSSDAVFLSRAHSDAEDRLKALGGSRPESVTEAVARLSERLHLSFAGDRAPRLYAAYSVRRLDQIRRLVNEGKTGLAFQALSRIEDEIRSRLSEADGGPYRVALRGATRDIVIVMEDIGPSSPAFRLKQRIEDLRTSIEDPASGPAEALYARLLIIESSVDAVDAQLSAGSSDMAKELLDTADQGMQNVERDIAGLTVRLPASLDLALNGKLSGLKLRSSALRERLNAGPATSTPEAATSTVPFISTTSTIPTTTTTVTIPPVTTTPTSTKPAAALGVQRIQISAQPSPVQAGEIMRFTVTGTKLDGTTVDVTSLSQFERFGTLGSLNGPTFVSAVGGSTTIKATYHEGTQVLTSSIQVTVLAPKPTLKSVSVTPIGNTTIAIGSRLGLVADATYSDGSKKDVTATATYSVSDPTLGSMAGSTFVANGKIPGIVIVTAKATENGVTVSGSIDLTISLQ